MSDFNSSSAPLAGLLVAGGRSRRMGRDKAAIQTAQGPLWWRTYSLLHEVCPTSYVSIRPGQKLPEYKAGDAKLLEDRLEDAGPLAGILTAFAESAEHAWLVLACDLPLLDVETLEYLIKHRDPDALATSYRSNFDGKPEPLCAIYEPTALPLLQTRMSEDHCCPRRFLMDESARVSLLDLPNPHALENANTPEDLERIERLNEKEPA